MQVFKNWKTLFISEGTIIIKFNFLIKDFEIATLISADKFLA